MTNKHKMDLSTPQALFVRAERSLRLIYVPLLVCILFQFFMSAAATTEAGEPAAKDRERSAASSSLTRTDANAS